MRQSSPVKVHPAPLAKSLKWLSVVQQWGAADVEPEQVHLVRGHLLVKTPRGPPGRAGIGERSGRHLLLTPTSCRVWPISQGFSELLVFFRLVFIRIRLVFMRVRVVVIRFRIRVVFIRVVFLFIRLVFIIRVVFIRLVFNSIRISLCLILSNYAGYAILPITS